MPRIFKKLCNPCNLAIRLLDCWIARLLGQPGLLDQDQGQDQAPLHPAVVKFKLSVAGLQSEDTTPSGSDRE